jgi:hypothetical protein
MKWQGELIYVSQNLSGENIGLKKISEHEWEMRFGFHNLGAFDELKKKVERNKSVTHVPGLKCYLCPDCTFTRKPDSLNNVADVI